MNKLFELTLKNRLFHQSKGECATLFVKLCKLKLC